MSHRSEDAAGAVLAEVAGSGVRATLRAAPAIALHGETCWRTDSNSPVLRIGHERVVWFSYYEPRGHTLRRRLAADLKPIDAAIPVTIHDDPDPTVGKWIEAIWQPPAGPLRGWYHAEELTNGAKPLFVPHIGEVESHDGGRTWRFCRELLRVPAVDPSWRNGFFAGGYGDHCVLPDERGDWLYLFFTSYRLEAPLQGVAVARMRPDRARPIEIWTGTGWQPGAHGDPQPIWPVRRGWRHADPDSFWGPAVHYNRALARWVMLLNRTANADADLRQEGIYLSTSASLDDPRGWSAPLRLVAGGAWFPQVIGLDADDGDTRAGSPARFFMAGFSVWVIELAPWPGPPIDRPLQLRRQDFTDTFGDRRCPW